MAEFDFSPDMASMATAMGDGCREQSDTSVDVWDLAGNTVTRTLDAGLACVRLDWTRHGLETNANPDTGMSHVTLWNPADWSKRLDVDHYMAASLEIDPKDDRAWLAGGQGQIVLFDLKKGTITERPMKDAHLGGDYGVGVSLMRDGKTLIVEDEGAGLQMLDAATLRMRPGVKAHPGLVGGGAVSPDGSLMAAFESPGSLEILRAKDLSRVRTLEKPGGAPLYGMGLAWLDDEHVLANSARGVVIWSTDGHSTEVLHVDPDAKPRCNPVGSAGEGAIFVTIGADCALTMFRGSAPIVSWKLPANEVDDGGATPDPTTGALDRQPSLAWGPRFGSLALTRTSGEVVVLDIETGKAKAKLPAGPQPPDVVRFTSDGKLVAAAAGSLTFLRLGDGERLDVTAFDGESHPIAVAISSKGTFAGPSALVPCAAIASGRTSPNDAAKLREDRELTASFFGRPTAKP